MTKTETLVIGDMVATVEIASVFIDTLNIDRSYQRAAKPHHKKIAKEFNPLACDHLLVNMRPDASLWTIDGQQRTLAMKILGIKSWTARVLNLQTVEEEAKIYSIRNGGYGTTLKLNEREKFTGLVAAKDPAALDLVKIGQEFGFSIGYGGDSREIACTSHLMGTYRVHGRDVIVRAFTIITQSWPGANECRKLGVIGSVIRLLLTYPKLNDAHAIKRFKLFPALQIIQEGMKDTNKAAGLSALNLLVKRYNQRLTKGRLGE